MFRASSGSPFHRVFASSSSRKPHLTSSHLHLISPHYISPHLASHPITPALGVSHLLSPKRLACRCVGALDESARLFLPRSLHICRSRSSAQ
ncbi:hypothetical protein XA68_15925 [Ophiocordyceps unilateralis]|uniref:Uncharacterized protein n=1 Tax=Ophiocordyceps unilateralis TaxID=268505 RepID=A0A2A9PKM4_OPHUN|nr:hypothetical protein XA68_15925 [Ophiocordyceps unilateralis]